MTPPFFIAKSFVTSIAFDVAESAQLSTNPILPTETSLHIEIGTRNSENNMYHLVEMQVHVSSNSEDGSPVYNLLLGYSAVVGSFDSFISETEWDEILKVQVPHALLDNIRSTVYQVTRDAGVPFMMRDDTFDNPIRNEETESSEPLIDEIGDIIESVSDVETEYPESEQCLYNPFDAFCKDTPDAQESEKIDFQWMINFNWANDDPELLEVAKPFGRFTQVILVRILLWIMNLCLSINAIIVFSSQSNTIILIMRNAMNPFGPSCSKCCMGVSSHNVR